MVRGIGGLGLALMAAALLGQTSDIRSVDLLPPPPKRPAKTPARSAKADQPLPRSQSREAARRLRRLAKEV